MAQNFRGSLILRIADFMRHYNSNLQHTVGGWPGKRVTYQYLLYVVLDEFNHLSFVGQLQLLQDLPLALVRTFWSYLSAVILFAVNLIEIQLIIFTNRENKLPRKFHAKRYCQSWPAGSVLSASGPRQFCRIVIAFHDQRDHPSRAGSLVKKGSQ